MDGSLDPWTLEDDSMTMESSFIVEQTGKKSKLYLESSFEDGLGQLFILL
jgi:hypothetical protein